MTKRATLNKNVLAENLFSHYYEFSRSFARASTYEVSAWLRVAEYVLDIELDVTSQRQYERSVKRQTSRIKERYHKIAAKRLPG